MILAVDAGNTRVKVMLAGPKRVVPLFAVETAVLSTDPRGFTRLLEARRPTRARLEGAALCSVVPAIDRHLSAALERATGMPVFSVRHTARFPFALHVANPRHLGADRLCAAAGVIGKGRSSAIVVDIGSAMTVDLIVKGEFRGGLIMPGPGLGLWALGRYAKRLPRIDFQRLGPPGAIRFDDTRPAMTLGVLTAARGALVDGVRLLRRSCGRAPTVFVTGGGAVILHPLLPKSWRRDLELVGRGLYRVWLLNTTRRSRSSRQKRA